MGKLVLTFLPTLSTMLYISKDTVDRRGHIYIQIGFSKTKNKVYFHL